jgi:hypothetical protein
MNKLMVFWQEGNLSMATSEIVVIAIPVCYFARVFTARAIRRQIVRIWLQ